MTAAVAVALAALSCAACGHQSSSASSDGSGTVNVLWDTGNGSTWITAAADAFHKTHPNITVKLQTIAYDKLVAQAATLFTSDDAPDISFFQSTMPGVPQLARSGALANVDDVWKNSGLTAAVPESASTLWSYNGTHYGIVIDKLWTPVIYYNKSLFAKAGLSDPSKQPTDAQWADIINKLHAADIQPLALGGNDFPAYHLVSALFQTFATPDQYQSALTDTLPGATAVPQYNTGPMLAALNEVAAWNSSGVFATGTASLTQQTATSLFTSGGAAMVSDGSWVPAAMEKDAPNLEYGWFLYPSGGTPSKLQLAQNDGAAIPTKAKNPVGAKLFLTFLASQEGQALQKGTGYMSARNDMPADVIAALPQVNQDVLAQQEQLGYVSFLLPDTNVMTAVQTGFAKVITGQETPQQVADEIQKAAMAARSS